MGDLGFEVGWEVDNCNCSERALLGANTASNTQTLRYEGDFRLGSNLNTESSTPHYRTGFLAFLSAFLRSILAHHTNMMNFGFYTFGLH